MATKRRRTVNDLGTTTGLRSGDRRGRYTSAKHSFTGSGGRRIVRVYATLKIPARAPRVVFVANRTPSGSTSFRLPRVPLSKGTSGRGRLVKRRVLLLIERPKRFDKFKAQVTVKAGKVHIVTGRRAELEAQASHLPTDRKDRKGQQKAGGHSAMLGGARLTRGDKVTLSANATSARNFDLAAAHVLGTKVKR